MRSRASHAEPRYTGRKALFPLVFSQIPELKLCNRYGRIKSMQSIFFKFAKFSCERIEKNAGTEFLLWIVCAAIGGMFGSAAKMSWTMEQKGAVKMEIEKIKAKTA